MLFPKSSFIACVFMLLLLINQLSKIDASSDDEEEEEEEEDNSSKNQKKNIVTTTTKRAIVTTKAAVVTTKPAILVAQTKHIVAMTTKPTIGLKSAFSTLRVGHITNKIVIPMTTVGLKTLTSTVKMQSTINVKDDKQNIKMVKKIEESEDEEEEQEDESSTEDKKNKGGKSLKEIKPPEKKKAEDDEEPTTGSLTRFNKQNHMDNEDEDTSNKKRINKNNKESSGKKANDDDESKKCQSVIFTSNTCCKSSPIISLDIKYIKQCSDGADTEETTDFFQEFKLNQFQTPHPIFNLSFKDTYQSLSTPMKFVECIFKKHKLITYDKEVNFDMAAQAFSSLVPTKWKSILTETIMNCSTIITDIFPTNEINNILSYPLLLIQCSRRLLLKKCYEIAKESGEEEDDPDACNKNHELLNKCNLFKPKEIEKQPHVFPLGPCPDLPCNKNPKYFNQSGALIDPFPPDIGKIYNACGTQLMFSNKFKNRKTFDDVQKLCCEYGMRSTSPISLGSLDKKKCLMEIFKKHHASEALLQFRTSGLFESTGSLMWCTSGQRTFRNSSWEDGLKMAKFLPETKCVTLMLMTSSAKFSFTPCNSNLPFMCELTVTTTEKTIELDDGKNLQKKTNKGGKVSCDGPKCSLSKKCNTTIEKSSYFSSNGTFLLPASKAVYKEGCGAKIIFDLRKNFFLAHMEECCKYGMRVLNIETYDKLQCLESLYRETFPKQKYEFLTRGTDYQCGGKWGWCEAKVPVIDSLWIKGSIPKETDGCAIVSFSHDDKSRSGLKWGACLSNALTICETPQDQKNSDLQKSHDATSEDQTNAESKNTHTEKKVFFSVLGNTKTKTNATKSCSPACGNAICVTSMATSKQFSANGSLRVPPSKAIKFTACGATYVLVLKKTNVHQADNECCEFGMKLSEIRDKEEVACLANKIKEFFPTKQTFHLRGSSFMCAGNWIWCDSKKPINPNLWFTEVPTEQGGCCVIELNPDLSKKSAMRFSNCIDIQYSICKDRPI